MKAKEYYQKYNHQQMQTVPIKPRGNLDSPMQPMGNDISMQLSHTQRHTPTPFPICTAFLGTLKFPGNGHSHDKDDIPVTWAGIKRC